METDAVSFLETLSGDIGFNHFTSETLTGLFIVIVLLAISALISGSEVALFSLEPKEIKDLKSNKKRSAGLVIKLLSEPEQLLAAILVGNNFVNIAIDMEKGMGPQLAAQWGLQAYPTLIILNSKGQPVSGSVGYIKAEDLIRFGQDALKK